MNTTKRTACLLMHLRFSKESFCSSLTYGYVTANKFKYSFFVWLKFRHYRTLHLATVYINISTVIKVNQMKTDHSQGKRGDDCLSQQLPKFNNYFHKQICCNLSKQVFPQSPQNIGFILPSRPKQRNAPDL